MSNDVKIYYKSNVALILRQCTVISQFTVHCLYFICLIIMRLLIMVCYLVVTVIVSWCWKNQWQNVQPQVCYEEHCWNVEVADEVAEQQRGLMNRTEMDKDAGMLFVFPKTWSRQFWMKNTLIPLDIIWLDGAWTVIYVSENTPPCTADPCPAYWPTANNALFVLEINAWQARDFWIQTWSTMLLQK